MADEYAGPCHNGHVLGNIMMQLQPSVYPPRACVNYARIRAYRAFFGLRYLPGIPGTRWQCCLPSDDFGILNVETTAMHGMAQLVVEQVKSCKAAKLKAVVGSMQEECQEQY